MEMATQNIMNDYLLDNETHSLEDEFDIYNDDDEDGETLLYLHEQMQLSENPYNIPTTICGSLMSFVAFCGFVGNVLTAYIFSRRTMGRASIGVLLTGLAITDALLLIVAAPLFAASAIYVHRPGFGLMTFIAYMTAYAYPLASALQTASVWLMMVTTMERYFAVCKPFVARTLCTRKRARRTVIIVLTAGALYNACRFWEYVPTPMDQESNVMVALPATLRENQTYILVYVHWMYFVFIFAIPFLVLSLVNGMVVMTIRKARRNRRQLTRQQRKEHATAAMMIVVACAYLTCTSLAFVLNAMELWGASGGREVELPHIDQSPDYHLARDDFVRIPLGNLTESLSPLIDNTDNSASYNVRKTTRRHSNLFYFLIDLNNLLVMIHCSVNFLIYYKFSQRFRSHVRALMIRGSKSRQGLQQEPMTADENTLENTTKYQSCVNDELSRTILSRFNSPLDSSRFFYSSPARTIKFTKICSADRRRTASVKSNESRTSLINSPNSPNGSPKSNSNSEMCRKKSQGTPKKRNSMEKSNL